MFLHRKELIQPVNVGMPDARYHVENAGIRDMLQDIVIEEFSHLEMVGKLIAQHTSKIDQTNGAGARDGSPRRGGRGAYP